MNHSWLRNKSAISKNKKNKWIKFKIAISDKVVLNCKVKKKQLFREKDFVRVGRVMRLRMPLEKEKLGSIRLERQRYQCLDNLSHLLAKVLQTLLPTVVKISLQSSSLDAKSSSRSFKTTFISLMTVKSKDHPTAVYST